MVALEDQVRDRAGVRSAAPSRNPSPHPHQDVEVRRAALVALAAFGQQGVEAAGWASAPTLALTLTLP